MENLEEKLEVIKYGDTYSKCVDKDCENCSDLEECYSRTNEELNDKYLILNAQTEQQRAYSAVGRDDVRNKAVFVTQGDQPLIIGGMHGRIQGKQFLIVQILKCNCFLIEQWILARDIYGSL